MRAARLMLLIAAVACGSLATNPADAYWWTGAYGNGIGGLYRSLDFPTELRVPYFASRPPVYYSQPVPRTYGYSPFAYPPTVRTPDVVTATSGPVEIVNPYVPSSAAPSKAKRTKRRAKARTIAEPAAKAPSGPLMIVNPFVSSKTI